MKRQLIISRLVRGLTLALATVCLAETNVLSETVLKLKLFMVGIAERPLSHRIDPTRKSTDELIIAYAKTNNIPVAIAVQTAISIAEESSAMVDERDHQKNTLASHRILHGQQKKR